MKTKYFSGIVLILLLWSCSGEPEISQWRGPDRNGIYPATGLLKDWPDAGPVLLWSYEGLGEGYGSVTVTEDRVFVLGMPDTLGVLYCFDLDGNLIWKQEYGEEWHKNFKGSRSTPTVADDLVYFVSGQSEVYCVDATTGEIVWDLEMNKRFGIKNENFGMAESPLIDGERLILAPADSLVAMIALDRFTGETIWTSGGFGESYSWCSPILVEHNEARLVVTHSSEAIIAIDAEDGSKLWRVALTQQYKVNAVSPVYYEGKIYAATAKDSINCGHIMINLSEDGKSASVGWRNQELYNQLGGIVVVDGNVYSSLSGRKEWFSINAETGTTNYKVDTLMGGAIIYADGLFYSYGFNGIMSLVDADANGMEVLASFEVPLGKNQHWAHPVIHNGRLYIRHGTSLMAYDISIKS